MVCVSYCLLFLNMEENGPGKEEGLHAVKKKAFILLFTMLYSTIV